MSQFHLPKELLGGYNEIVERGGHVLSMGLLTQFGTFNKMPFPEAAVLLQLLHGLEGSLILAVKSSHILDTFGKHGFHFGPCSS